MRGLEKNRMERGHTHTHTCGHRDSMIESAQWADSMKIYLITFKEDKTFKSSPPKKKKNRKYIVSGTLLYFDKRGKYSDPPLLIVHKCLVIHYLSSRKRINTVSNDSAIHISLFSNMKVLRMSTFIE